MIASLDLERSRPQGRQFKTRRRAYPKTYLDPVGEVDQDKDSERRSARVGVDCGRASTDGSQCGRGRRVLHARWALGARRRIAAGLSEESQWGTTAIGLATGAGRHFLCAANRLPMESRAARIWLGEFAASLLQLLIKRKVFPNIWRMALLEYDDLKGIDWDWQTVDGAMTKQPLGGKKNRAQPDRPRQVGDQSQPADRRGGDSDWLGRCRGERPRQNPGRRNPGKLAADSGGRPVRAAHVHGSSVRFGGHSRPAASVRLHVAHQVAQPSGKRTSLDPRLPRPPLGLRASAFMVQSLPPHPRSPGNESRKLHGVLAPRMHRERVC